MTIVYESLSGNAIVRDSDSPYRWYDAYGANVVKLTEDFVNTPFSAADQPAGWLNTLIEVAGQSTAALVAAHRRRAAVQQRHERQRRPEHATLGGSVHLRRCLPTYFGCRFKIEHATLQDCFAGLCITMHAEAGMTDGCTSAS